MPCLYSLLACLRKPLHTFYAHTENTDDDPEIYVFIKENARRVQSLLFTRKTHDQNPYEFIGILIIMFKNLMNYISDDPESYVFVK